MSVVSYKYSALDGHGRKTEGTIRAAGEQEAYRKINASGMTPLSLEPIKERGAVFSFQRVTLIDVVNLTRELAVLVEARIPLDRGLRSIAEHEKKAELASMVRDLATMIESGQSVTQSLEKYRHVFGDVYIETMRAAEKSGSLQQVTGHLAEMLERQMETRQQVRRAMMYPVIVSIMVGIALTVIVGFVVPKFARTFAAQGNTLPLATRIIQGLGFSVQTYWWAYALALLAAIVTVVVTWRNPAGRLWWERLLARTPYVGKLIISVTTARFSRVMGIALASGLDVIESLSIAGRSTGRPVFVQDCDKMSERLRQGERLADVLDHTRYLPAFARRMLGAGKDSKEVARACDIVSRHYDREASHLTKNVNTIIEPLMTVALAGIVLVVALSVFLPMWQMARVKH
jgi:type II secretory pathway component PulF